MKRIILSFTLILLCVFLCSCGSKKSEKQNKEKGKTSSQITSGDSIMGDFDEDGVESLDFDADLPADNTSAKEIKSGETVGTDGISGNTDEPSDSSKKGETSSKDTSAKPDKDEDTDTMDDWEPLK